MLTSRTASISLPIYDWEGKRCIPLLLHLLVYPGELVPPQPHHAWQWGPPLICLCSPGNQIPWDTCAMDAYWQWRGMESKMEVKASAFFNGIQQGITHDVNTHVHLRELEDVEARPGEDPKILSHASRHWWTAVRWSMMSTKSTSYIVILSVHTAMRESSLANLWQNHSRHLLAR